MLVPEQVVVAALALTTAVTGGVAAARAVRRGFDRRRAAVLLALALATLVVRVVLVAPVLLHANLHGAPLVDEILGFPRAASERAEYGQGAFVVLGALSYLTGHSFEGVVLLNQLFAVATLVLLGLVAARLAGRPRAAAVALLLGALNPALMRVAGSEDAHTLATFLGAVALLGLDVAATERDRAALVCGAAAALLMLWTRQTLYPVAVVVVGLPFARASAPVRRARDLRVALGVVAAALLARVAQTSRHPTDAVTLLFLPIIAKHRFSTMFAGHPLLDLRAAPALLPLGLAGLALLWRRPGGRVLAGGLLLSLLVTLPFAFPSAGVELSFRMPTLALWLVPAAVGAERALAAVGRQQAGAAVLLGAALALLPAVLPSFRRARETTAATEEMRALRKLAPSLPADAAIVTFPSREPAPEFSLPRFAFPPGTVVVPPGRRTTPGQPRFLVVGLRCRERTYPELVPETTVEKLLARDFRLGAGVPTPTELRPDCRAALAGARPATPAIPIAAPDDPPFAFFGAGAAPLTVSIWRLAGT